MPYTVGMGTRGGAEVRIAGKKTGDPLNLAWAESAHDGTKLFARFALADDNDIPNVGDKVEFEWEADEPERTRGKLVLWCAEVRVEHAPGERFVEVEARDPLAFCDEEPQFRSYPGRITLMELARQVLAFQPGKLDGMEFGSDAGGKLPQEYLLQCGESGRQFLARIGNRAAAVLRWNRDRFVSERVGSPSGEQLDLTDSPGLKFFELRTAEPALKQLSWLDPVTRASQVTAVKSKSWSGANGARGLARPASAIARPETVSWIGEGVRRTWNGTVAVLSSNAAIRVGSLIKVPGGRVAAVESVNCTLEAVRGGNFQSSCDAVPKERWGLARRSDAHSLLGPFQAVVMENDDPERLGRIRVALSEDPERRVTPWLPALTASAGNENGLFWIPEKGSLVLVAAPAACAEALFVLGGVRDENHRASTDWRSSKNARKALAFRNGVQIVVDDDQQTLRLETKQASWQLDGRGFVKLKALDLDAHLDQQVKLEAGARVAIDAARIDLG